MKKEKERPAYIWKHTKYDGMLPIINFQEGIQIDDPSKMKREVKAKTDLKATTLTKFVNGQAIDSMIQHKKL